MDLTCRLFNQVPIFYHLIDSEIDNLRKISRLVEIKKGQQFDVGSIGSFHVIVDGIFEFKVQGRNDVLYLTGGAFFGEVPFVKNKHHGSIRALTDSSILILESEDTYKFFLKSFRAFRGYIKSLDKIGLDISSFGRDCLKTSSSIISVYSLFNNSGKSILASYLGHSLGLSGKTIILDLSYRGNSIFNIFGKKITPAISQKKGEEILNEQFIYERIERINDNLSILNIVHGSNIKAAPEIISPILFLLSKNYKFIIIDISDYDEDLRDQVFALSDIIYFIIKKDKDRKLYYSITDRCLTEGQRVYYVLNKYFSPENIFVEGCYIFDNLRLGNDSNVSSEIEKKVNKKNKDDLIDVVLQNKTALVLETNFKEALAFAGFLKAIENSKVDIDFIYSSYMSYIVLALYLLSDDERTFDKNLHRIFSEETHNSLLDITFPEENVFKNNKIYKFSEDIAGDKRIESFRILPLVKLNDDSNKNRIFSFGFFKDLMAASFLLPPIFESLKIGERYYNSGFPFVKVRSEDILRSNIKNVAYVSVKNKNRLEFMGNRILKFYKKYIEYVYFVDNSNYSSNNILTENIILELDETEFDIKKILKNSEKISEKLLSGNIFS